MLRNRFAHSGPLMKELGVLNVKNIYNYLAGQLMLRYVNKLLPNVFESYFTLSTSVHAYNTRQQSSFRLPYYRTNLGKRSVRYTGVKIWSEVLKSEIDIKSSQPVFKHNLKRCLLQGIICLDCSKVTAKPSYFFGGVQPLVKKYTANKGTHGFTWWIH